jgi:hypothetical protein
LEQHVHIFFQVNHFALCEVPKPVSLTRTMLAIGVLASQAKRIVFAAGRPLVIGTFRRLYATVADKVSA